MERTESAAALKLGPTPVAMLSAIAGPLVETKTGLAQAAFASPPWGKSRFELLLEALRFAEPLSAGAWEADGAGRADADFALLFPLRFGPRAWLELELR